MRIKTLLKTLILLCIIVGLSYIVPHMGIWASIIPIVSWIGIIVIALFYIYYVIVIKKSSLFCLTALFFAFLLVGTSVCAATDINDQAYIEQEKKTINSYKGDVCSGSENYTYDAKVLEKAHKIVDIYKKLSGDSKSFGGNSDIEGAYKCAQKYIEHAGEIQKTAVTTCNPITFMLKNAIQKKGCWPCDITALVINSIQKMAVAAYSVINEAALALLGGIFLMWIAVSILIFFGKFGFSRISEFFTNLLNQAILVLIIAAILHAPIVNFYRIVISPFITYTAGLAISFSDIGTESIGQSNSVLTGALKVLHIKETRCSYCTDMNSASDSITSGQFMDSRSINGILCLVCTVYRQVAPMISLGQAMVCYATAIPKALSGLPAISTVSLFTTPNLSVLFMGYILVILFTLLMFIIGFYIMSVMMKLGFILIFTPLFLVAFAFKFSRNYAKQAWTLVVHSMLTLVAISIAISLLLIGFNNLLPKNTLMSFVNLLLSNNPQMFAGSLAGVMTGSGDDLGSMMNGGLTNMVTGSSSFSTLLLMSYAFISLSILNSSSKIVERLANAWINVSDSGVQALTQGAGAGMTAIKSTGSAATHMAGVAANKAKNVVKGKGSTDSNNDFTKAANRKAYKEEQQKEQNKTDEKQKEQNRNEERR